MRKRRLVGRPQKPRRVCCSPGIRQFKPAGILDSDIKTIVLTVDELEAIRLADLEEMYQEEAATEMNISRQTFGRIVSAAHSKIARAIIEGQSIKIEGGTIMTTEHSSQGLGSGGRCICIKCNEKISHRRGIPCKDETCPKCGAKMVREGSHHHDLILAKKMKG